MTIEAAYFKEAELRCKCGCGLCAMAPEFVQRLDLARRMAAIPFHISSGYRCARHNEAVGGVRDSSHTLGRAVDIGVCDSPSRYKVIHGLLDVGFSRIGIGKSLIHVDDDPAKEPGVIWIYPDK